MHGTQIPDFKRFNNDTHAIVYLRQGINLRDVCRARHVWWRAEVALFSPAQGNNRVIECWWWAVSKQTDWRVKPGCFKVEAGSLWVSWVWSRPELHLGLSKGGFQYCLRSYVTGFAASACWTLCIKAKWSRMLS